VNISLIDGCLVSVIMLKMDDKSKFFDALISLLQ